MMKDLIGTEKHEMTLADYEARIYLYKEQIGTGYIGIGRTLNEARAAGAVPHGEWEAWVTRITGLTPRQAQRCMQAAREIREGSAIAQLEMSKALMLLSSGLSEESREEVAEQAAREADTVLQLRQRIEAQKRQEQGYIETIERADRRITEIRGELGLKSEQLKSAQEAIAEIGREKDALGEKLRNMDSYVEQQKKLAAEDAVRVLKEDHEYELREIRVELEAAQKREARRAEEVEKLRAESARQGIEQARAGIRAAGPSVFDLGAAVRAFIGAAGVLPQMGETLRGMPAPEKESVRQQVETVARWVEGAREALGVYPLTGASLE